MTSFAIYRHMAVAILAWWVPATPPIATHGAPPAAIPPGIVRFCAPIAEAHKELREVYKEQLLALGTTREGKILVEIWVDPKDGSFSILNISTEGFACMILSGEDLTFQPNYMPKIRAPY